MKTLVAKNSIYFCGKVKDLKSELEQYSSEDFLLTDLIKQKLN